MSDDEFLEETLPHLDMLFNLARRMTRDPSEAEDLVQETYLKALQGWRRARPERTAPWLATICLNIGRSRWRRRSARPIEILEPNLVPETASGDDTEGFALARLDREVVHDALMRLPDEQREAIALMDLCGFTASQAATILGAPRNTVLSRVHRGHKRLALMLEEVMRDDS